MSKFNERKKCRPGNYKLLATISSILDGCHSVRPEYRHCHYPVVINKKKYKSRRAIDAVLDKAAREGTTNKRREYNLYVNALVLLRDSQMREHPTYKGMRPWLIRTIEGISKRYKGTCMYAHLSVDAESLQSDKVDSVEIVMLFAYQDDSWALVLLDGF